VIGTPAFSIVVAMKWRRSWSRQFSFTAVRCLTNCLVTQFGFQGAAPAGSSEKTKLERSNFHPGSFCPGLGARDVGSEHFEAVGVEVDPIGAFGLCRTQHRATSCIEERLDESDLSVLEIDLTQAQRGDLAAPSARRYRERQVSVERGIDGRDVS
jgi:hypothetical protein